MDVQVDNKLCFVYQSKNMQRLYRKYGKHLVLLDATYKVCKYSLPLFFLVVQTNVNFQLAAIIVVEDESSDLLTKALETVKEWNPDISPKYGMVDFDTGEILALEKVFSGIEIFLCDFHREQSWQRWVNKKSNGVFMIAEEVKCRLRRIANSHTIAECQKAISDFRSWEHFNKGRLADWFEKTWYPELVRWCLAFRPDDLFRCNTNNGTERLNESLKYYELIGYKNCSLSELLCVLIDSFVPNLYEKYVSLNIRYTDGHKRYNKNIPSYMVNRPGPLVEDMLQKLRDVTSFVVSSVSCIAEKVYLVRSLSATTNENRTYTVKFGDDDYICSCDCASFKRHRLLCKHFFAVIKSGLGSFKDISSLYLNHPYTNIDYEVLGNVQVFAPDRTSVLNPDEQEPTSSQIFDLTTPLPPPRRSKIKVEKQMVISDLKVLTEKVYCLNNYNAIKHAREKLNDILQDVNEALDIQNDGQLCTQNNVAPTPRRYNDDLAVYSSLPEPNNVKNQYAKRRGKHADVMKKQYLVPVPVPLDNKENISENVIIDGTIDHHDVLDFEEN